MPFWNLHEIRKLRKPNRFQPQAWHIWRPQNPATKIPAIPYIPCSSGIAIPSTSLCTAPSICSVKVLVLGGGQTFLPKRFRIWNLNLMANNQKNTSIKRDAKKVFSNHKKSCYNLSRETSWFLRLCACESFFFREVGHSLYSSTGIVFSQLICDSLLVFVSYDIHVIIAEAKVTNLSIHSIIQDTAFKVLQKDTKGTLGTTNTINTTKVLLFTERKLLCWNLWVWLNELPIDQPCWSGNISGNMRTNQYCSNIEKNQMHWCTWCKQYCNISKRQYTINIKYMYTSVYGIYIYIKDSSVQQMTRTNEQR